MKKKQCKIGFQYVNKNRYWSISNFSVTIIKSSYGIKKWKKDIFYNLRHSLPILFDNDVCIMWKKLNQFPHLLNSPESQENWDSLAKNNFVRATFQKNTKAYRNCCVIYLKSKHLHKHWIYNESRLNNKTEKAWHLVFCAFHCCCWCF